MLVNNVNGEAVAASMVRDSEFYIELAKFVQAYTTIIHNPNIFLAEVGESAIDEKQGRVSWAQLVKIMTTCDFGFKKVLTDIDLKVYYNYALQMGSLDSINLRIASVSDIAEAQKHYYNFVDKAKDRAESEYLKQHKVYLNRENEMKNADNQLSLLSSGNVFAYIMMIFSMFIAVIGVVSLFLNNAIAEAVGKIIPVWEPQYIGAIILIVVGLIMFILFDKMHIHFHRKHFKLKLATEMIFVRGNESYEQEIYLKRKLTTLIRELKVIQAELNDKNKKYDVQENINKLKTTNKYYKQFAEEEPTSSFATSSNERAGDDERNLRVEDFAPVKLTKEQEENLRRVSKEAIILEGQFDEDAYKEKFEKSRNEKEEASAEAQEDNKKRAEFAEKKNEEQLKIQEQELIDSIDYIKGILGFSNNNENEKQR